MKVGALFQAQLFTWQFDALWTRIHPAQVECLREGLGELSRRSFDCVCRKNAGKLRSGWQRSCDA